MSATLPASSFCTADGGTANPIPVPLMVATATPTSRPLASTTGPPLFPGLRAPSICTTLSSPSSSRRMLDTAPRPTVMAGFPFVFDSASPNGNPNVKIGVVSTGLKSTSRGIGSGGADPRDFEDGQVARLIEAEGLGFEHLLIFGP